MRLVTYDRGGHRRLGAILGGEVVDLPDAVGHPAFPTTLEGLVSSSRGTVMDAARAALERRTIHIPDVRADPEYTYGAKDAEAIRTVLGVPILKGDDLLGVMMIYHLQGVRPFTKTT